MHKKMKGGGCNMKKKLLAVLSLVMVLAMESVTVFATEGSPSPNSSNTISGAVGGATVDAATGVVTTAGAETIVPTAGGTVYVLNSGAASAIGDSIALSEASSDDYEFTTVKPSSVAALANVYDSVKTVAAANSGANVEKAFTVDVTPLKGQTSGSITVSVPGITSANDVAVLHENSVTGAISYAPVTAVDNGSVTFYMDSFSAVMIVVFDRQVSGLTSSAADYSAQGTTTVSGDVSPKTADAFPYDVVVAVFAVAAIAVCGKKLAK
jgi:hypothetical protein